MVNNLNESDKMLSVNFTMCTHAHIINTHKHTHHECSTHIWHALNKFDTQTLSDIDSQWEQIGHKWGPVDCNIVTDGGVLWLSFRKLFKRMRVQLSFSLNKSHDDIDILFVSCQKSKHSGSF